MADAGLELKVLGAHLADSSTGQLDVNIHSQDTAVVVRSSTLSIRLADIASIY